jgi:hypothetical protein
VLTNNYYAVANLDDQGFNDAARSVDNWGQTGICLWSEANYWGDVRYVGPGKWENLPSYISGRVSSVQITYNTWC